MGLQEQIFQAIDIITDKKLRELKFDKTIEAIILDATKADSGEYTVQYQDLRFVAYSSSNTIKYKKDDNVLVLIPDGDMSNRKTIMSSSKSEGQTYIDVQETIDKLGINFLDEPNDFKINLSTTKDDEVVFRVKENALITMYPGQKMIYIGAEISGDINSDYSGDYGIELTGTFSKADGTTYIKTFALTLRDVTGNPYNPRGYKFVKLPLMVDRLVGIVQARAYSTGFRGGYTDITISNIEIEYVTVRDQDGSEYTGNIIAPKGLHFKNGVLYPTESLDLVMQLKQKGQVLDTDAVEYRWFVMDSSIDSTENDRYNPDAGLGWRWMLPGDFEETLISGLGTKAIQVYADFIPNFASFKCLAYYKTYMVSSSVTVVDHAEQLVVDMSSSNGVTFANGIGTTVLTCSVTQNGKPIQDTLTYKWSKIDINGNIYLIKSGNDNTLSVSASEIGIKMVYICEIIVGENTRPSATGTIALVSIEDGKTQGVAVVGGFRTVLYDADGRAPENFVSEGMRFDFYENGEKVTENIDWTWYIPAEANTMLTMDNATVESDGRRSSKDAVIYLNIIKNFDINKTNNTVTLVATRNFQDRVSTVREVVNISITKVGSNGADGASGKPGVDGNTYVYEIQGGSPTLIYDKNGLNPQPNPLKEFMLMFSENGNQLVVKDVDEVTWRLESASTSLLSFQGTSTRYIKTYKDGSANPHKITLVPDNVWSDTKYNNYISAEIIYKGQLFRETFPVSVTKNGTDGEMGLTISTIPPAYTVAAEADGNVPRDISILVNFDITKSDYKVTDYEITSSSAPGGIEVYTQSNNTQLLITFKQGYNLPEDGIIEIGLDIEGKSYVQAFSFSKTRDGESPYTLILTSTNGIVFKQGDINTVVMATVFKGTENVTDIVPQSGYIWEKVDKNGSIDEQWEPNYVDNKKYKIIITPLDILERATFNCRLEF